MCDLPNVFLHHTLLANLLSTHIHQAVNSILCLVLHGTGLSPFIPYVFASCHVTEFSHSVVVHELMSAHCHVPSVTTPLLKEASMAPGPPLLSPLIVTTLVSPGKVNLSVFCQSVVRLYFLPVSTIRLPLLSIVILTSMSFTALAWRKKNLLVEELNGSCFDNCIPKFKLQTYLFNVFNIFIKTTRPAIARCSRGRLFFKRLLPHRSILRAELSAGDHFAWNSRKYFYQHLLTRQSYNQGNLYNLCIIEAKEVFLTFFSA